MDKNLDASQSAMRAKSYDEQLQRVQAAAQNLHELCANLEQSLRKAIRSGTIGTDLRDLHQRCKGARGELDHLLAAVAEAQDGRMAVTGEQRANANLRQIRAEIVTLKGQIENGTEELLDFVEDVRRDLCAEGNSRPSASIRRAEVHLQLPESDSWNDRGASA
ncbi:hypothetical protein ACFYNL_34920 [Streptomyces sp. NPDC007808]|uniref:hypothetical protein n=1 Tax=Streptomyces sp. NPDC007808 TaxID=3364779 RepID=UPI0036784B1C